MANAIGIIRAFTTDDDAALNAAAERFAARHGLTLGTDDKAWVELDQELWSCDTGTWPRVTDLKRLWQACRCRALGVQVSAGIVVSYGYVGYRVN